VQWGTNPGEIGRKLAGRSYTDIEILQLFSNPTVEATSNEECRIYNYIISSYYFANNRMPDILEYRKHMHHLLAGKPLYDKFVTLVDEYNY